MPHTISADGYTVNFDHDRWELEKIGDLKSTMNMGVAFEALRGDNTLRYKTEFANLSRLPGQVLPVRQVQDVLVGYQANTQRWVLGLHILLPTDEKPTFRPLVFWQAADIKQHQEAALTAARALAALLGLPLKVYGNKKAPTETPHDQSQSGVTGPLGPHARQNIPMEELASRAKALELPLTGDGFTLATSRNGLILKLNKNLARGKIETPLFNLCEINTKEHTVKLVPPTGLLGAFMRDRGREIRFEAIFNLEYRVIHTQVIQKAQDNAEEIIPVHVWGIYLTLKDESLLLLQASFMESVKLKRAKTAVVGGAKLETNSAEGLRYFQEHLAEESAVEQLNLQTEQVAYCLAYHMGKRLVKTEIDE